MNTEFLNMPGGMTVTEAIHAMREINAHALIVDKRTEEDELGIVLVSDIAKKVLAMDRSPDRVNLYEIMTKPVLAIDPDMNIRYCARFFEHFGISTAPVGKQGKVIGIVTYDALVLKGLAADL
ncbi:MAG: CBS domain-containing protein [Gammaproteobacteria bacterium]|nr:CBS domain-containing protein [Gammaproteobacteria bacterium]